MTRRGLIGLLAGAAVLTLGGCKKAGQPDPNIMRYKMTVEVETPDGPRTGVAVREVELKEGGGFWFGEGRSQIKVRGEAVVVDLPDGQTLFALLASGNGQVDYAGRDIRSLFKQLGGNRIQLWPNPPETNRPIIRDPLPMLVTFRDIDDPTSVEKAEPDDLAASLGNGYALKSITVTITDDSVTSGIEKRLGWLRNHSNMSFAGNRFPVSSELPDTLMAGAFTTELSK